MNERIVFLPAAPCPLCHTPGAIEFVPFYERGTAWGGRPSHLLVDIRCICPPAAIHAILRDTFTLLQATLDKEATQ